MQTVNNPSGRRTVRISAHTPESPGQFTVYYEVRRFRHYLIELRCPFVHIGIPSVGAYDNEVIMERKSLVQFRFIFQQILKFRESDLYISLGRNHRKQFFQYGSFCFFRVFQSLNRTVPFAPCANHSGLYDQNQIFIFLQERFQLIQVRQYLFAGRTDRRPSHKVAFVGKTQYGLFSLLLQFIKICLHGPEVFFRQLFTY